jgi:hypothetical protein
MTDDNIYFKLGEMHGDIKSILTEAKKTNGRVTKLEGDVVNIKLKIAYYAGGVSIIIYILTYLAPKLIEKIL